MIKYAKVANEETGLCHVGIGTNTKFYISVGMTELDVELSEVDGEWYLAEKLQTDEYKQKLETVTEEKQNLEIKQQLEEIDAKTIRALRAGEADKLAEYEAQAVALREQLNK